ncbi:ataxin-7-like protein 2a isoform X1 [Oncorhynchus kisutch]|uniref:Ataxin 7-like 2a n=1 Tax=Oncorhynchus kisutch TaxID=8019 RepID=A0A8C7N858_ONCKI|nr:ataxin-7-like protein 2 isoform X1 [Oncorhynchus kisutch]
MMAVCERAVKVMAALERRVPSLDDFVGQSWSAWAERAGVTASEGSDGDDCSKNGKNAAEAMSLRKEDMSIFGHYPGQDDFYLVVCSHCGQVVKPQAFEKHCERRHGPLSKLYARLRPPPPAPQQRPRHSHSPSSTHATSSSWEGRGQGSGAPRAAPPSPSTPPQFRHTKPPKDVVRHSPLDKSPHSGHSESAVFKQPPPLEPPLSSPLPSLRDPPWPHGDTPPGRPSNSEKTHTQRKEVTSAPNLPAHLRGPRPYNKVASRRECDLDKHCGVLDPERKKVCTRLLTCNIHSIHQRRKVPGRSKNFDQLVAELKTGARIRERGGQTQEGSGSGRSPSPEAPEDPPEPPHCRRPLTNNPAFSRSRASLESAPEEDKPCQEEGSAPSPLTQGRISSDESEGEGPEEPYEYPSSSWHPKPAAVCSFGSHEMGRGVYAFDRRLHHLRSALNAMVEQHISAHLWKKIPQASDLQSQSPSAKNNPSSSSSSSFSSLHSKVRTGSHSTPSLRPPSSSSSHGPGRETRLQIPSHSTVINQSANSSACGSQIVAPAPPPVRQTGPGRPPGPGRPKNPVGRPSKQQLRLREEAAAAAALRKRKAPSQEGEHCGPDRNSIIPQDRGRPPSTSSKTTPPTPHSQTNGTLSPSSKPRPQPSPSEPHSPAAAWAFKRTHPTSGHSSSPPDPHSRGGDSGLHGRGAAGYEHRGLGKKRKGGSSEPSPPSKLHRLPSSPRSNFYPWKDSKGGALPGGLEKKMGTQKPKLHH